MRHRWLIAVARVTNTAKGTAIQAGMAKNQASGTTAPVPMWMILRDNSC